MLKYAKNKYTLQVYPAQRRDPRVFVAVHRSRRAARMLFLQKSALSETLGVIANVPHPRRDPRVFVAVRRSSAVGSPAARSLLITS